MFAGAIDDAPESWGRDLWAIVKLDHDLAAALAAMEAANTNNSNKSNNNNNIDNNNNNNKSNDGTSVSNKSNNNDNSNKPQPPPPAVTWMRENCYPSEPIFVPRPGGVDEGIVSTAPD